MNPKNLSDREKNILIDHFMHHLPLRASDPAGGNNRATLMAEYPQIYNKMAGAEIVQVVNTKRDNAVVKPSYNPPLKINWPAEEVIFNDNQD